MSDRIVYTCFCDLLPYSRSSCICHGITVQFLTFRNLSTKKILIKSFRFNSIFHIIKNTDHFLSELYDETVLIISHHPNTEINNAAVAANTRIRLNSNFFFHMNMIKCHVLRFLWVQSERVSLWVWNNSYNRYIWISIYYLPFVYLRLFFQ